MDICFSAIKAIVIPLISAYARVTVNYNLGQLNKRGMWDTSDQPVNAGADQFPLDSFFNSFSSSSLPDQLLLAPSVYVALVPND